MEADFYSGEVSNALSETATGSESRDAKAQARTQRKAALQQKYQRCNRAEKERARDLQYAGEGGGKKK